MTKQNKTGIAEMPELDLDPGSQFVGPLYGKVKNVIKKMIISRKWLPEIKIPSENELVETLKVSRMTVNRALRELTAEGSIRRATDKVVGARRERAGAAVSTSVRSGMERAMGAGSSQIG